MDNMKIYDQVRKCPDNALRKIQAGRLKGKSDINPMWRIKALTEQFGAAGIGWTYEITKQWLEQGADGEVAAFCNINLFINPDGVWSKPIPGTGGSSFIAKERNGLYTSDECFKMALTDAISVACKALGFAADVYWDSDKTKYSTPETTGSGQNKEYKCTGCGRLFEDITDKNGKKWTAREIYLKREKEHGKALCKSCLEKAKQEEM